MDAPVFLIYSWQPLLLRHVLGYQQFASKEADTIPAREGMRKHGGKGVLEVQFMAVHMSPPTTAKECQTCEISTGTIAGTRLQHAVDEKPVA